VNRPAILARKDRWNAKGWTGAGPYHLFNGSDQSTGGAWTTWCGMRVKVGGLDVLQDRQPSGGCYADFCKRCFLQKRPRKNKEDSA